MVVKKIFYALTLLALIVSKVSSASIHIHLCHGHDDEHEEQCELCACVIYNQLLEFSTPSAYVPSANNHMTDFFQQKEGYESVCAVRFAENTFFVRPPPTSV